MAVSIEICPICNKRVRNDAHFLNCTLCTRKIHRNCTALSLYDLNNHAINLQSWSCQSCNSEIFPFNHIIEMEEFNSALYELRLDRHVNGNAFYRQKIFDPFSINDVDKEFPLRDLDPDVSYFNDPPFVLNRSSNYYTEDSFNKMIKKSVNTADTLSMLHLNIKSIPAKLTDFLAYLENLNHTFPILAFSETWLTEDNRDCYHIPGYNHVSAVRTGRIGGGVSLYILDGIEYYALNHLSKFETYLECIFVEVLHGQKKYIIGVIYRPPNTNMNEFIESISDVIGSIRKLNCPVYLMGDYNMDLLKSNDHKLTGDFLDMMYSHSYIPLINRPTRITDSTGTIIDNIYTNNISIESENHQGILSPNVSDHEAVFHINIINNLYKNDNEYQLIRQMNKKNYDKYINIISIYDWSVVKRCQCCQEAYTCFSTILSNIYNSCFPVIKVKQRYRNRLPWLTDTLKRSIKHKNYLYKIQVKHPTIYNKTTYKRYRCIINALMRKEEKKYYQTLILDNKNNLSKTWKIIKEVINKNRSTQRQRKFKYNDKIIVDNKEIASHFNEFFANVGPTLASQISDGASDFRRYLPDPNPHTIFLSQATNAEVKRIILSFKNGAPGWDGFMTNSIKCVVDHISDVLCYISNLSLKDGVFPTELKLTQIVPIYKSSDPMQFTNYRPISLLSVFSKLLERIMYNRLIKFVNKYNLLYLYQFGFREGHSTYMPLIILMDKITEALDNGNYVVGIFLDFRKAFDTVDHKILLNKLYSYGIRGIAHDWFSSYLHNRQQFVKFSDACSDCQTVKCGIPQGSILGPLLFLMYINDLPRVSRILLSFLFADDTNLFITGNDIQEMVRVINRELANIVDWLKANKLSLNIDKTNFILFRPKSRPVTTLDIRIEGTQIQRVTEAKFLGVIIDEKLNWSRHITFIKHKISKSIGIIKKTRRLFDTDIMLSLYNSFVYPYLSYCIHVWGMAYDVHKRDLVIQQKRIVRIIAGVHPRESTRPIFLKLKILQIDAMYSYNVALFMYKYVHGMLPPIFHMYEMNTDVHYYNTRQSTSFHIPLCTSNRSQRTIRYTGTKLWNKLNQTIDINLKIGTFKKHVKNYIFCNDDSSLF